jgi:hypothetical protein
VLCAVLIAAGLALASVIAFGSSNAKDTTATPALTLYPPATTRIIAKLSILERLARSKVTASKDAKVHAGLIVLTTREQAAGGDVVNSNQPVYELILSGHFTCEECTTTARAGAPTGSYITVSVDRSTLSTTDFGIGPSPPAIPAGARVYRFTF